MARLSVLVIVMFAIVLQHRVAKVVVEVAIHTVKVIGIVLGVVVLDQESWPLDKIVVWLTGSQTARPDEVDFFRTGAINAGQILICQFLPNAPDVFADKLHQNLSLIHRHRGRGHAAWLAAFDLSLVPGREAPHGFCEKVRDFTESGLALLGGKGFG